MCLTWLALILLNRVWTKPTLKMMRDSGLIGLKAEHVVLPCINSQNTITLSNHASAKETSEQSQSGAAATPETNSSSSSTRPATTRNWNSGTRKQRPQNSRKNVRQWVRKDPGGAAD